MNRLSTLSATRFLHTMPSHHTNSAHEGYWDRKQFKWYLSVLVNKSCSPASFLATVISRWHTENKRKKNKSPPSFRCQFLLLCYTTKVCLLNCHCSKTRRKIFNGKLPFSAVLLFIEGQLYELRITSLGENRETGRKQRNRKQEAFGRETSTEQKNFKKH